MPEFPILKHKIWSNEYIQLNQLLNPDQHDRFNVSISSQSGVPSLCLLPKNKETILTIEQWNAAFTVYMTIYLTSFPTETHAILKYSQTINHMFTNGGDFITYDKNVRYMRQSNISPWDTFHTELYVRAVTGTRHNNGRPIPRGYCFEHHAGRLCTGCVHSHKCPWCGAMHPANTCPNPGTRRQTNRPQTANNTYQPFRGQNYREFRLRQPGNYYQNRQSYPVRRGGYYNQQSRFRMGTGDARKPPAAYDRP